MVLKVLAIIAVLFIVYIIFFKKDREKSINNKTSNKKEKLDIEADMYECPTCKTFVSRDEAILSNGRYYCSKECLK